MQQIHPPACGVVDFRGCCLCSAAAATIPVNSSMKDDVVAAAALRSLAFTTENC
jgi:hypothetical protein